MDTTIISSQGENFCKGVGNKYKKVGGEWVYLPKALITLDVVTRPPINKDRRSFGEQVLIEPVQCCPNLLANNNSKRKFQLTESKVFFKVKLK